MLLLHTTPARLHPSRHCERTTALGCRKNDPGWPAFKRCKYFFYIHLRESKRCVTNVVLDGSIMRERPHNQKRPLHIGSNSYSDFEMLHNPLHLAQLPVEMPVGCPSIRGGCPVNRQDRYHAKIYSSETLNITVLFFFSYGGTAFLQVYFRLCLTGPKAAYPLPLHPEQCPRWADRVRRISPPFTAHVLPLRRVVPAAFYKHQRFAPDWIISG